MSDEAPTLLQTTSYGAFLILVEWRGVPQASINGEPLGYIIRIFKNNMLLRENSTSFLDTFSLVQNLSPGTQYVFEVCAYNSLGPGPCDRITGSTLESRKIFAPCHIFYPS